MYLHRILASAITSYDFAVLFNLIIATIMAYVIKMAHHIPESRITGQERAPSLPNEKNTEGFGFSKPWFQQKILNLNFIGWLPL